MVDIEEFVTKLGADPSKYMINTSNLSQSQSSTVTKSVATPFDDCEDGVIKQDTPTIDNTTPGFNNYANTTNSMP
jgi:hypothetical protein